MSKVTRAFFPCPLDSPSSLMLLYNAGGNHNSFANSALSRYSGFTVRFSRVRLPNSSSPLLHLSQNTRTYTQLNSAISSGMSRESDVIERKIWTRTEFHFFMRAQSGVRRYREHARKTENVRGWPAESLLLTTTSFISPLTFPHSLNGPHSGVSFISKYANQEAYKSYLYRNTFINKREFRIMVYTFGLKSANSCIWVILIRQVL